jgi:SagB-type dehydrogenase family enzyme
MASSTGTQTTALPQERIVLPTPRYESKTSLERTLRERRSVRSYKNEPLALSEVSQLLWAAQGMTDRRGLRTAPSAGALYPLEVYVVSGQVVDLAPGVYKYRPNGHELVRILEGDQRANLFRAALSQSAVREAPLVLVLSAVYERTMQKYGERGIRYADIETGHAAQNVCLQAVAMGLGTVLIGAFSDDEVKKILNLVAKEQPLYLIP